MAVAAAPTKMYTGLRESIAEATKLREDKIEAVLSTKTQASFERWLADQLQVKSMDRRSQIYYNNLFKPNLDILSVPPANFPANLKWRILDSLRKNSEIWVDYEKISQQLPTDLADDWLVWNEKNCSIEGDSVFSD